MEDSKGSKSATRVFLENLPNGVRKDEIGKEFYNFGDIAKIYLMYDDLGSGFVEFFDTEDAAYAAEQMNGVNFRGSRLKTRLTQGGVARGRGNFNGGRRSRGRGFSSNYGDRYGSDRYESSGQSSYRGDSGYQSRRGGFPRRGRGGSDRFERDSGGSFSGGRNRMDREWNYSDNNDRESSFRTKRFSSRNDREGHSSRGRKDFSDRAYDDDGISARKPSYIRNEYSTRDDVDYSESNFKRMGDRDHGSRQFRASPTFKKGFGRSAEENDIIVGVKPSRYVKKVDREHASFEDYQDPTDKYSSYRKPKRDHIREVKEILPESDNEDYHHLRDRSRSPMHRQKKENYATSSYEQKGMSYVTEDGMHRSRRVSKHSEKPMREDKDFISSHRRHRSREETDRY